MIIARRGFEWHLRVFFPLVSYGEQPEVSTKGRSLFFSCLERFIGCFARCGKTINKVQVRTPPFQVLLCHILVE